MLKGNLIIWNKYRWNIEKWILEKLISLTFSMKSNLQAGEVKTWLMQKALATSSKKPLNIVYEV